MDAPPEKPSAGPSDETHVRPKRNHETRQSDALESRMDPPWKVGERRGDYVILKLLGRGKAGFVYAAEDLVTRRRCALKVLCRMSSHDLYRNKLGFRRMSPFRHPSLLRTDRIEVIDGFTVLSMEEIRGTTLFEAVRLMKSLPKAKAYAQLQSLLHDYAMGLSIIHMGGVIHRDLKPTNLMVRGNGRGVIVDYGLVANCDPETDPYGIRPYIAGTPRYFSPEALWEQSYTPAGDVFSLGLVMLDCLNTISGRNIELCELRQGDFENWVRDEDEEGISAAVLGLTHEIPAAFRRVVTQMLSVDRAQRPASLELVSSTIDSKASMRLVTNQHLYGRERELEEVIDWLRGIYRGQTGRLHLYGPPGSGKTRLLDEVERQVRQHNWVQVFRVKCRSRENQTLQVMDQISDQIAARYGKRDREMLRLDPVSATILTEAFPQLRHVIKPLMGETSEVGKSKPERLDALEAAKRLSLELRKVGPLIIIIDDAQWSDHDSNSVWDELQQDTSGMLGIITSSRTAETNQRQAAQKRIYIGPLEHSAALHLLQHAAKRWNANINSAGLLELVEVSRCNPFRLQELAEEFRPGGMLHQVEQSDDASISNLGEVDRLWKARFDRLSEDAKSMLAFIVTANAPVSLSQLAELTGLAQDADAPVTKLVQQRLVNDDATGKECITVVHDKIATGLIENLPVSQLTDAHLAWAELLSNMNRPRDFAARIASHYYAAGKDGEALPFAIQAAFNADRAFAKSEAGEWHERVLKQVTGDARDKHLRDAARCYREADLPMKASALYLTLADETKNPKERILFETLALELLVRSGQMDQARPLIDSLSKRLGINVEFRLTDLIHNDRARLARLARELCCNETSTAALVAVSEPTHTTTAIELGEEDLIACRLHFCKAISRPLSMLHMRNTIRLVVHGAELALEHGDIEERVHFGAMAAVWTGLIAGDHPRVLDKALGMLTSLRHRLAQQSSCKATAEVWAGIGYIETLAMRWSAVPIAVDASVRNYRGNSEPLRFEVSHTRWMRMWADWHLGRWDSMRSDAAEMVEDAQRRNDSYQQFVATSGYSGNAFLISGRTADLERFTHENCSIAADVGEFEFVDFFRRLQLVQFSLFIGDFEDSGTQVLAMKRALQKSLIRRVGLVQTAVEFTTALVSLHLRQMRMLDPEVCVPKSPITSPGVVRGAIRQLRGQSSDFPRMLAAMLSGIRKRMMGRTESAAKSFEAARAASAKLGWLPYELAADDALLNLAKPDADADSLRQRMANHHVADAAKLERLYTVAPVPIEGSPASKDSTS